jgi:uncharacterized protein (DUF2062 family)
MFKRRNRLTYFERLKELVWPRQGWRRSTLYIAHRLGRLPGTPYRVAAGFACGAAISFTPFFGLHFLLAALLCLILRGSILASAIGTVVGNPWTFPFIGAWTYSLGSQMIGSSSSHEISVELTFQYFVENLMSVGWPMTVGALPTAVVVWCIAFVPIYFIVYEYQRARQWRIRRKATKARKQSEASGLSEGQLGKQT